MSSLPKEMPTGSTCLSQLRNLSIEDPDKQAFVFIDKDWNKTVLTRKGVWDNSRKFASKLLQYGINRDDVICDTLVNSPERLITSLGTVVAGAISMHGQFTAPDGEDLIHNLRVAKAKAIIVDPGHRDGPAAMIKGLWSVDEETGRRGYRGLPDLCTVIEVNVHCYGEDGKPDSKFKRGLRDIEERTEMYEQSDVDEQEMAFVFSTTGTTGFAKQVPHSHKVCLRQGRLLGMVQGIESDASRYYSDRSLGWLGGYVGPYLFTGATHVLTDLWKGQPNSMDQHLLRMLNDEKVDCGVFLIRDVEMLSKLISGGAELKKRLRAVGLSGMPICKRVLRTIGSLTDAIVIGYGATEVGYNAILRLTAGSPFEDYCVGVPLDGYEIQIKDERGADVPTGKIGLVRMRGLTTTPGYLNEREKTKEAFTDDGFFLVGDIAYRDANGLIYILGRHTDVMHKDGAKIYPGWVESRILKCPGVAQVIVIGVPGKIDDPDLCACIVASDDPNDPSEGDIQTECQNVFREGDPTDVSSMPKYFMFMDAFPLNDNGKTDRKQLTVLACNRFRIDPTGS